MKRHAGKVIRVDMDVYRKLQEHAEPLYDTPNSVLRRLLKLPQEKYKTPRGRSWRTK